MQAHELAKVVEDELTDPGEVARALLLIGQLARENAEIARAMREGSTIKEWRALSVALNSPVIRAIAES